jgi:hypothetical protein
MDVEINNLRFALAGPYRQFAAGFDITWQIFIVPLFLVTERH